MIPRRSIRHALVRIALVLAVVLGLLVTGGPPATADPHRPTPDLFPSENGPLVPDRNRTSRAAEVIQDLGAPISSLTIMEGAIGRTPDGRDVVYAVPAGENALLNVVDLHSRQLLNTVTLNGAAGAWAIVVAS